MNASGTRVRMNQGGANGGRLQKEKCTATLDATPAVALSASSRRHHP
jgi:hypothetical protein